MLNRRSFFKFTGVSLAATQVRAEAPKKEFSRGKTGLLKVRNTTKEVFCGKFYIGSPQFKNNRIEYHYFELEFIAPPWGATPDPFAFAPIWEQDVIEVYVREGNSWKHFTEVTPLWQNGKPGLMLWNGKEILRA